MGASRQVVREVLALAFARSSLRNVIDFEALDRCEERVFAREQVVDLEPLWEVAAAHAHFEQRGALPPFCWLKNQERRLGWNVVLPAAARSLSRLERDTMAKVCPVKDAEVERIVNPEAPLLEPSRRMTAPPRAVTPVPGELGAGTSSAAASSSASAATSRRMAPPVEGAWKRNRTVGVAAGVIGALALAYVGLTLVRDLTRRKDWETVSAAKVPGLPVASAKRHGRQLNVRLSDKGWFGQSEADRREQLTQALIALAKSDVEVVIVEDDAGKMRASVQWGSQGGVYVRFY